jgi:cyclophilin family peptidyl-prolyl cis-trans isomerase
MTEYGHGDSAQFETTLGNFTAELFESKVLKLRCRVCRLGRLKEWKIPKPVRSTRSRTYDGIIFHRSMDS